MVGKQKPLIIEWTETAERQLFNILDYWTIHNKSTAYAEKLVELVWDRTNFISNNPNASPKTSFPGTQKAAIGHFSIFYKVIDSKVLITAFWDNRNDPKKLYDMLKDE